MSSCFLPASNPADGRSRYAHLQKTGALKKLLQSHDPHLPPRTVGSLQAETEELNKATEQLQRQAAALKAQNAGVEALRSRQKAEAERKKKLQGGRASSRKSSLLLLRLLLRLKLKR